MGQAPGDRSAQAGATPAGATRAGAIRAGALGNEMRALEWHEHLLGCTACRELLEAEQALEELLASLPEPRLPAELTRRVLARLRANRLPDERPDPYLPDPELDEEALDELLALDSVDDEHARPPRELSGNVLAGLRVARARDELDLLLERDALTAPAGLTANTLAALAAERQASHGVPAEAAAGFGVAAVEEALDALLALDRVEPPVGLPQRVRNALADERAPVAPRGFSLRRARVPLTLAAGLLIAFVLWFADGQWSEPLPAADDEVAQAEVDAGPPELELLEALAVLEDMDLLGETEMDLDLLLELELAPEDEALLAYHDDHVDEG